MVAQEKIVYQETAKKKGRVKDIDRRIGERIREIRGLRNMSQTELADILDVSFQQFQKYEKGQNRLSFTSILILSHALKTPINEFIVEVDDSVVGLSDNAQQASLTQNDAPYISTKEKKELLESFGALEDPKVRKHLLQFIKGAVESRSE